VDSRARILDTAPMRHPLLHRSLGLCIALAACGDSKSMSSSDGTSSASSDTTATTQASDTATSEATSASGSSSSASDPTSEATSASGSSSAASDPTTGGVDGEPAKHSEACAPDDGSAVEFSIAIAARECSADFPEDAPIFRIVLFQGVAVPVGEHKLDGGFGFAYFDDGGGMPVTGDTGSLTIVAELADGLVGSYNVTLSDNTVLSGSFTSIYCPQDVLCG